MGQESRQVRGKETGQVTGQVRGKETGKVAGPLPARTGPSVSTGPLGGPSIGPLSTSVGATLGDRSAGQLPVALPIGHSPQSPSPSVTPVKGQPQPRQPQPQPQPPQLDLTSRAVLEEVSGLYREAITIWGKHGLAGDDSGRSAGGVSGSSGGSSDGGSYSDNGETNDSGVDSSLIVEVTRRERLLSLLLTSNVN